MSKCKLDGSAIEYIDSEEEVVNEAFIVGAAVNPKVDAPNAGSGTEDDEMVDYDTEDGTDGAGRSRMASKLWVNSSGMRQILISPSIRSKPKCRQPE